MAFELPTDLFNLEADLDTTMRRLQTAFESQQWLVIISWRDFLQHKLDLERYFDEAICINEWAIEAATHQNNVLLIARYTHDLADMHSQQGNHKIAESFYSRSYDLYEQAEDRVAATKSLHMLALTKRAIGENPEAETLAQQCLKRARVLDMGAWEAHPLHVLAWLARDNADYEKAIQYLSQALEIHTNSQEHDRTVMLAQSHYDIARTLIMIGSLSDAEQHIQSAIAWSDKGQVRRIYDMSLKVYGDLAIAQRDLQKAQMYYELALDKAQMAGDERRVAELYISLARVFWGIGLGRQAIAYFQMGVAQLRRLGLITPTRLRTLFLQGLHRFKSKLS
jgi:tetratricopeptide (TPR) repeat protein